MAITPNTNLFLLKCPLTLSGEHQLDFINQAEQITYFLMLPKIEAEKFSYQRKDSIIRFPANIDSIIEYNYVMYRNSNYGNKWFYAFITDMTYSNDGVTLIHIKTDVWQTWQFDLNYKPCFVEREHTNNDSIGSNLLPENLELGEYVINSTQDLDYNGYGQYKSPFVAIGVSEKFDTFSGVNMIVPFNNAGGKIDGLTSGLTYIIVLNEYDTVHKIIEMYDNNSKADAIVNIFPIPYSYLHDGASDQLDVVTYTYNGVQNTVFTFTSSDDAKLIGEITSYPLNSLNGYTPNNNKLLTYPYMYEKVTNNGGIDVTYNFEDFSNRQVTFRAYASLTQGMSIKLIPINYMGRSETGAYEYGITGQKLPTCSWSSDFYLNWINQQGQNLALQTALSVGQAIIGGASSFSNGISGIAGGLSQTLSAVSNIASALQQERVAKLTPDQSKGNINSGDVNFSIGKSGFTIQDMSIKYEYAKCIDDYFTIFGYKTNEVKLPNITGRRHWNYIKTIGCNILADIPQNDLDEIKRGFDRGITIWHHPNSFMNYNLNNDII